MALRIIRNDITKMNTEAIVNTANGRPDVGPGCDHAVYLAAGYDELLTYRKEKIGSVREGKAFITPGFKLAAKYIIHAVSPRFKDGRSGEERVLRSCYKNSLRLAKENDIRSVSFPLISTGSFGYPKEEGLRIALDEINAFLAENDMEIYLVVFDDTAADLGKKLYPGLEEYIDRKYVEQAEEAEYAAPRPSAPAAPLVGSAPGGPFVSARMEMSRPAYGTGRMKLGRPSASSEKRAAKPAGAPEPVAYESMEADSFCDFETEHESKLAERMKHLSDTFSEYLLYLIKEKDMENAEVYNRAIVDKKVFSKIKNNPDYHPQKLTALCLCVGARLNLDEAKDLLARAGYALSPCDKTDIIFSYFIENEIYDMLELDIQLEEHGLPCIIS